MSYALKMMSRGSEVTAGLTRSLTPVDRFSTGPASLVLRLGKRLLLRVTLPPQVCRRRGERHDPEEPRDRAGAAEALGGRRPVLEADVLARRHDDHEVRRGAPRTLGARDRPVGEV